MPKINYTCTRTHQLCSDWVSYMYFYLFIYFFYFCLSRLCLTHLGVLKLLICGRTAACLLNNTARLSRLALVLVVTGTSHIQLAALAQVKYPHRWPAAKRTPPRSRVNWLWATSYASRWPELGLGHRPKQGLIRAEG